MKQVRFCSAALASALFTLAGCGEVAEVLESQPSRAGSGGAAVGSGAAGSATKAGGGAVGKGGNGATSGSSGETGAAGGGSSSVIPLPQPADPALGVVVDAGDAHACATRFGILYCWGANGDGRLGVGDTTDRNAPARVGPDADWVAVATGVAHTCALKSNGSVWCFGANNVGQLGQGSVAPSSVPLEVALPSKAVQLSSEANTACVVLETGELYCWGRNWEGNIGLNDTHPGVDQVSPVRSGDESDWKVIGTGDGHTCGVRGAGLLFGWGRNTAANLGLGQTNDQQRRSATPIGSDEDWQSVVSGQDSSCGIKQSGALYCWGSNAFGNLGLGDTAQRLVPTPVEAALTWAQISIDTFHGCGIDSAQQLYCWGRGIEGQLGTGDINERLAPVAINLAAGPAGGGADMTIGADMVAVGRMFTCAVSADARVLCTGENAAGQLGLADPGGANQRRSSFTELAFP